MATTFYFFTDIDLLDVQSTNEAFGPAGTIPINSVNNDQYRITSIHTASADPNAYAICDGTVFIQEDSNNSNLVNLVLLPASSPEFDFPKIRFFVYKGMLKSSLINGNEIALATNNDLTSSLWASQNARNTSAGTTDNAPSAALGIDLNTSLPDTDLIEDVFYRDNVNCQFPNVSAGWSIGVFDQTKFGLEIVFENGSYDPPLLNARTLENFVKIPSLTGSETQPQFFEHWHDKETILNYADASAFYGLFYHSTLNVKDSSSQNSSITGNQVYDDVLIKFYNKNRVYVDVRNEYNFSFDYFKNYGVNIHLGTGNNTATSFDYYSSLWPILILETNDFPTGNTSTQNIIRIALPDGSGENTTPSVFISSGFLSDSYPEAPKEKQKLLPLTVSSGLTDEISLAIPNRDALSSTTPFSSYIKIKYLKRFDPTRSVPVSSGTVIRASQPLDHIFSINGMRILFSASNNIRSVVYDAEHYVDFSTELQRELILRTGIAEDTSNITYYAYPEISIAQNDRTMSTPFSLSAITDAGTDIFLNYVTQKFNKQILKEEYILTPSNVEFLEIIDPVDATATDFSKPDFDELITLALDKDTEYDSLTTLVSANFLPKYKIFFGLINSTEDVDGEGYEFMSYDVVLRGFEINSGNLQVKEVNTNIKIYG